jgi:hypothetical protein
MLRSIILFTGLFCACNVFAQGLFESGQGSAQSPLSISGYTRGAGYFNLMNDQDPKLQSLYGESSLKLKATAGNRGMAFTDIRFRTGTEYGTPFNDFDIREAYADLYVWKFDIRIGKQISSWGRTDGFNPTDNLTPRNYFIRSSDPDDMRMGNLMARVRLTPFEFLKIEADIVPWYNPSLYRFDLVEMPEFVTIGDPVHPGFQRDKSTFAIKADLICSKIEGSVSWFSGYDAMPVLGIGSLPSPPFTDFNLALVQRPFSQQTLGADLATIILKTGIRAEFTWKQPIQPEEPDPLLPVEEVQWALSLDREFGPFRIIAAYNGKFIPDFIPADPPAAFDPAYLADPAIWSQLGSLLTSQIGYYNRILFDQTHEWSHTCLIHPSVSLFHETLDLELTALYNFATDEYLVYPMISWKVADGAEANLGYQYYFGDENTRFHWIRSIFNGPFAEIKINF